VIETLAALAEPNRFHIVQLLRAGPRPVNDIGERLRLNQPQVSKHLRVLKEAGLVDVEPHRQQRLYALRPEPLRQLHEWLAGYREMWEARSDQLDELIAELNLRESARQNQKRRKKEQTDGSRPRKR
jgi:DNA-binding transcriptional ArsR family regulator